MGERLKRAYKIYRHGMLLLSLFLIMFACIGALFFTIVISSPYPTAVEWVRLQTDLGWLSNMMEGVLILGLGYLCAIFGESIYRLLGIVDKKLVLSAKAKRANQGTAVQA